MRTSRLLGAAFLGAALAAGTGACSRSREPATSGNTPKVPGVTPGGDVSATDERLLDEAVAMKRSGDPFGAWKKLEALPKGSSLTLDARYLEVLGAYSDARTQQIGREIAAPYGGGPKDESVAPHAQPGTLNAGTMDRLVGEKTHALRDACYKGRTEETTFVLVLRIDEDGSVDDVATGNVQGEQDVAECVKSRAKKWRFPPSAHGGDYTGHVIFGPADRSR